MPCIVEELDAHEKVACDYKKGGILTVGVLKTGHGITDFTDDVELNAAIAAGTLRLIKGIKGIFPDAAPIEGENPIACGSDTILDGFDLTLTWKDFNITALNDEFYRQLNSSAFSGLLWYYCQEQEIRVVEKSVTFVALPASAPESNKEKQFYNVVAKWSASTDDVFPTLYVADPAIFV